MTPQFLLTGGNRSGIRHAGIVTEPENICKAVELKYWDEAAAGWEMVGKLMMGEPGVNQTFEMGPQATAPEQRTPPGSVCRVFAEGGG